MISPLLHKAAADTSVLATRLTYRSTRQHRRAALLLQQRPTLTPDQVKKLLASTAVPLTGVDTIAQGAGAINVAAADRRQLERQRLGRQRLDRHVRGRPDLGGHDVDGPHLVGQHLDGADLELRGVDRQHVVRADLVRPDVVGPHLERRLLDLTDLALNRR